MRRFPSALAAAVLLLASPTALAGGSPAEVVVLVNRRSSDSKAVAGHYVQARNIPPQNVCEVDCAAGLTIPMEDFTRDVVDPLRAFLRRRQLEDQCRFLVLTQGMPIRARTLRGGFVSTAAALALLDTPRCGVTQPRFPRAGLHEPVYRSGAAPTGKVAFGGRYYLVTALVSTTAEEAQALVDRSVASDGTAPKEALFSFQDAAGNAKVRNARYDGSRAKLEALGHRTEHLPAGADQATGRKRLMGVMSGGSYSKLTVEGVATNDYLPGAICDMLQSFGAVPENFTPGHKGRQFPVTHLIRAGITGVHGAVAEPYAHTFPHTDLFLPYAKGFTLAEAFHQSLPFSYWMNLVIGDPLCAPYARRSPVTLRGPDGRTLQDGAAWSGEVEIAVAAPLDEAGIGPVRIDVYVDGQRAAGVRGSEGTIALDTTQFADGPRHVLAVGTAADEAESRSWTALTVHIRNDSLRVLGPPRRINAAGAIAMQLSREPSGGEVRIEVRRDGRPVAGQSRASGNALVFVPEARITERVEVRVAGIPQAAWLPLEPRAGGLSARAPPTVAAGTAFRITVVPFDFRAAASERRMYVEVRTRDPARRFGAIDARGETTVPLRLTRAGTWHFDVVAPGTGHAVELTVEVRPATPHHATTPLGTVPLGHVIDVPVHVEDAFGNRVIDWSGSLSLAAPGDAHARIPGPQDVTAGTAVFRDVVLTQPGRHLLVIEDANGRIWSQPGEGVTARPAGIRAWLLGSPLAGAAGERLFEGDAGSAATGHGAVSLEALFRRHATPRDEVRFRESGTRNGDVAAAVAEIELLAAADVRFLAAAPGELRVRVDGKQVFAGVPKATNPRRKPQPIGALKLSAGRHVVTVAAVRKGRFSFALQLDDGAGAHPAGLRVHRREGPPGGPSRALSGRLLRTGGRGVAGGQVEVSARGKTYVATTAADGSWWIGGIAPGKAVVRARGDFTPPDREITVRDAHVVDLDFRWIDAQPPVVEVTALGKTPRFDQRIVLTPRVEDPGGIAEVWLLIDGKRLGGSVRKAPWRIDVDASGLARGEHELVVVAHDRSRNEGCSKPLVVELVVDREPPSLSLRGLSRNAVLKKPTTVEARAEDHVGVASVVFLLDGEPLASDTSGKHPAVRLDPAELSAGRHVLEAVARDLDGRESSETLTFRVR